MPHSQTSHAFLACLALWLAGSATPLSAEEAATVIAAPAVRLGEAAPCRIVPPTFEPKTNAGDTLTPTRYSGGAKLTLPIAAPCPVRSQTTDL